MVPTMCESLFWALIQIYSLNSHKNPVKSGLLLFPLYRWKLGHRYLTCQNPHGFDTTESILQHGGETQAFPRTTRNETDCIRRVRGVTIYWPHHPSLRPAQYHIRRSTLHLRVYIHIPQHCGSLLGSPYSDSASQGSWAHWWHLLTGILIVKKEAGGASNNQCLDLSKWTCSAQEEVPTSGFAHMQSQDSGAVWPGNLTRCRSAWFGNSNKEPSHLWNLIWRLTQAGQLSHSPVHCWV